GYESIGGYHADVTGVEWIASDNGRTGLAKFWGGADEMVTTSYPGITGTGPRSISVWIRIEVSGVRAICSWGNAGGPGARWSFYLDDGKLELMVITGQTITGITSLNDGIWHHVLLVFPRNATDVGDVNFYVDGVPEPHNDLPQFVDTGCDLDMEIGQSLAANTWRGWMDDVRIYDIEISPGQVAAIYAAEQ
ncbi:MAG: LamG domain-containing protein, partial [Planctomycetales bacterium]